MATWCPWPRLNAQGLAQYAVPSSVRLLRIDESSFDLHRTPGGRRRLVEVIYDGLVAKQIRYNLEPFEPRPNHHKTPPPQEILVSPGQGTCLDLAILFCGLSLGYDLLPILVVLEGHA